MEAEPLLASIQCEMTENALTSLNRKAFNKKTGAHRNLAEPRGSGLRLCF